MYRHMSCESFYSERNSKRRNETTTEKDTLSRIDVSQRCHTREQNMTRLILAFMIAISFALGISGCAAVRGNETSGEHADDATITTRVEARYAKDPTLSAMRIQVHTNKGMVALTGTVNDQSQRQHAENIAAGVPGVKSVQNNITLRVRLRRNRLPILSRDFGSYLT